jgi:ClpP class serine protease
MTKAEIIQYITNNYWLVTEQVAASFHALLTSPEGFNISDIAQRKTDFESRYATKVSAGKKLMPYKKKRYSKANNEVYTENEDEHENDDSEKYISPEGVAVVHIKGLIQKDSDYCTRGTDEINAELLELGENPRIKGVVLYVDSGGGQVAGTEQLADTVYNFKRRFNKRIEAVVDTAGSAAYWIVSGCDKIYLSGNTSAVGSIGTMATIVNSAGYESIMGLKVFNIYATLSYNKNKEVAEALEGRPEALRVDVLDKLNKVFLGAVIRGRYRNSLKIDNIDAENAPEQLTGKMYFGKDAITIGLADGIATLEQVLVDFDSKTEAQFGMPNGSQKDENTQPEDLTKYIKKPMGLTPLNSISKL